MRGSVGVNFVEEAGQKSRILSGSNRLQITISILRQSATLIVSYLELWCSSNGAIAEILIDTVVCLLNLLLLLFALPLG